MTSALHRKLLDLSRMLGLHEPLKRILLLLNVLLLICHLFPHDAIVRHLLLAVSEVGLMAGQLGEVKLPLPENVVACEFAFLRMYFGALGLLFDVADVDCVLTWFFILYFWDVCLFLAHYLLAL